MILSLTGPSGVGKTTLLHHLLRALPGSGPLISYTTRTRRQGDEPGEYRYVGEEEFEAMHARGEFLWVARPHGKKYATREEDIGRALAGGVYMPILLIDAAKQLRAYAAQAGKADAMRSLYIRLEDEAELRRRFAKRGDSLEAAEARIAECRSWNQEAASSGVPFIYIDGRKTPEEMLADALAALTPR